MTRGWAIHARWRRDLKTMKQSLEASWAMSDSPVPLFTLSFNVLCLYGFCYFLFVSGLWFCSFAYGYLDNIDSMVTTFLLTFSVVYQHDQFSLYGFGIFVSGFPNPRTVCMY